MKYSILIQLTALLLFCASGLSADKTDEEIKAIVDSLKWKEGTITLEGNLATIDIRDGYRFIDGTDASKVLTDIGGNPPSKMLGMLFPPGTDPLNVSYAVIIEGFEKEGFVKDDDADKIDPAKLLQQIQEGQKEDNAQRKGQGYAELEIVGWAVPPHYDKESKKIFWALDIKRVGGERHSVNYYVRILGRQGYLVINALGGLGEVKEIESAMPSVLSMINFNEGQRYADFNPKTDKVAAFGIAGLILGAVGLKVAAKLGIMALLLKKFGFILIALKKLWIVIIAIFAGFFGKIKSFFTKKKSDQTSDV